MFSYIRLKIPDHDIPSFRYNSNSFSVLCVSKEPTRIHLSLWYKATGAQLPS